MPTPDQTQHSPFRRAYDGLQKGVLRWSDLDALWTRLLHRNDGGWYVYAVGETPPAAPASRDQFARFLSEIRWRLQDGHEEDYCGIVYADDHENPGFVKIFDPGNLGAVCGSSANPPLPGWTLSRIAPDDLQRALAPARKRRWWQWRD